ncbi:MAG TPA: hypothetical protein PK636_03305 [bacterium]|nr:hypothetical protein [bacterium]
MKTRPPHTSVWGVGGLGCRVAELLTSRAGWSAPTLGLDGDSRALVCSELKNKLQLGPSLLDGEGAVADPERGAAAVRESAAAVRRSLKGADSLVLIAGLAGGIGAGAVLEIGRLAREEGVKPVVIGSGAFRLQGRAAFARAARAAELLEKEGFPLLLLSPDRYLGGAGEVPAGESFKGSERLLAAAAAAVVSFLTRSLPPGGSVRDLGDVFAPPRRLAAAVGEAEDVGGLVHALKRTQTMLNITVAEAARTAGVLLALFSGSPVTLEDVNEGMECLGEAVPDAAARLLAAASPGPEGGGVEIVLLAAFTPGEESRRPGAHRFQRGVAPRPAQTEINFEVLERGKFAGTEPTLLEGEDLDIPTFIRRGESLD